MTSSSSRQQLFKKCLLQVLGPIADEQGLTISEGALGQIELSGSSYRLSFFAPEGHECKINVTVSAEQSDKGRKSDEIAIDWFNGFTSLPKWQSRPCRTDRALNQAIAQVAALLPQWLALLTVADAAFWRKLRLFVDTRTARA